jgi:hypothetical protein
VQPLQRALVRLFEIRGGGAFLDNSKHIGDPSERRWVRTTQTSRDSLNLLDSVGSFK